MGTRGAPVVFVSVAAVFLVFFDVFNILVLQGFFEIPEHVFRGVWFFKARGDVEVHGDVRVRGDFSQRAFGTIIQGVFRGRVFRGGLLQMILRGGVSQGTQVDGWFGLDRRMAFNRELSFNSRFGFWDGFWFSAEGGIFRWFGVGQGLGLDGRDAAGDDRDFKGTLAKVGVNGLLDIPDHSIPLLAVLQIHLET